LEELIRKNINACYVSVTSGWLSEAIFKDGYIVNDTIVVAIP